MPNPVVHFEVIGRDAEQTQQFYRDLFGWNINTDNPMNYGMVEKDGEGIGGGVAAGDGPRTTFYVAVDDLQATLDRATALGGAVVMPVTTVTDDTTLAMFADRDGNVIGLVKGM